MKKLVKNNPIITIASLLLALGGTMLAVPAPALRASPLVLTASAVEANTVEDGVEAATTSRILALTFPDGANRITSAEVLAKFDKELQEGARTINGTVTHSEVLLWTGDAAKTVIGDVSARLKEMGYATGEPASFDSEVGRVTPVGALRGDKSDSLMGMWIETKEGATLLVWGRFKPDATAASDIPAKPAAAPKKAAAAPKKVAVAAKPKAGKSPASSPKGSRPETDAERRAKAFKAYNDYQYVKLLGPISGPMYRSTKW